MNKSLIAILVLVIILLGGWFLMNGTTEDTTNVNVNTDTSGGASGTSLEGTGGGLDTDLGVGASVTTPSVKEFTITAKNFSFTPNAITVNKGDKVKITFKNSNGFHDLKIDEYNVATKQIQGGSQDVVEFTADKAGTFEYYCSVGTHRAMGMVGTLKVQ